MLLRKLLVFFLLLSFTAHADTQIQRFSPDRNIQFTFTYRDNGSVSYQLTYKGKPVIDPSGLGFNLIVPTDNGNKVSLTQFTWQGIDTSSVDETWKPVWG